MLILLRTYGLDLLPGTTIIPANVYLKKGLKHQMTVVKKGRGVIFDLDGVLVDTGRFHKQAWYELAEKEGFSICDNFFYNTFGMQNYQIIRTLAQRELPVEQINRLSEWKEQRFRELIAGKPELLPGARALVDELKSRGFLLAVGSSTPRANLDFILNHVHIRGRFDAYVTSEDVSNGKPAPDTFLKAAEKLSLLPGRCVAVEDAVQGVQAGKSAGMAVVAVTTTRSRADLTKADIIVDRLTELKAEDFIKLLGD